MAGKILLIINSEKIRNPIAEFLKELNYKLKVAEDGKHSIEMVSNFSPDMILCEQDLPVITGMELARLFKSHDKFSKIPFLLITPKVPDLEELEMADVRIAADDFVQYPIDQTSFYGVISKWIESDERPKSIAERLAGELAQEPAPKSSKPWKRGKVNAASVSKLFFNIIRNKESGVMRFKGNRRTMEVSVSSGKVVEVVSNYIREDTLGRFLIRTNRLTKTENDATMAKAKKEKIPQGQILIKMNILTEKELEQAVTQQKTMKFLRLYHDSWADSVFEFTPKTVDKSSTGMEPSSLSKLLKMGLAKIASERAIYNIFTRNNKTQAPIILMEYFDTVASLLKFDSKYLNTAKGLHGQTIDGIKVAVPKQFGTLLRIAFLLIITKAAEFAGTDYKTGAGRPTRKAKRAKSKPAKAESRPKTSFEKLDPKAFNKQMTKGRKLLWEKDYLKAQRAFENALTVNPESSEAMAHMAWAKYQDAGRHDLASAFDAKELLKQAIEIDKYNDTAFYYLGKMFKNEGKTLLAEGHFQKAVEANPSNTQAKKELALLASQRRRS